MTDAAWEAILLVCSWPHILYPVAGTLLAMLFAVLPGVSPVTVMALAIPLTLHWDLVPLLLFFGGLLGGGTFMGSVTAILFNIPGTAPNAATMLDGYPLARQGLALTAIGCSAAASALGATVGVVVLVGLIPVLRSVVLAFGPPEILMLAIWGLTTLAVVTRDSPVKGLVAAGLGLLLAFVGSDPRTAEARFTLGLPVLQDGLDIVPVFLGLLALTEIIDLMSSGRPTISGLSRRQDLKGSVWEGATSVIRHFGLFVRCSGLGTIIGVIPGIGGTVASFVAYAHALQSAGPDRERFGHGDLRGVLAPEAANDAKDGGALIPTLAFGIPGSELTALLLTAFALHGILPGERMLSDDLTLTFVIIWALLLSNWLTSVVGLATIGAVARLTLVRTDLMVPFLTLLVAVGAFALNGRTEDVVVAMLFGFVGYGMKKYGWPRIPLVIALVLGPLFEVNFHLTWQLQRLGRVDLFTRPIVLVLAILCVVSLVLPCLWDRRLVGRS